MKSKSEHGAMPCTDHATPETTGDAMVNDPVSAAEVSEILTLKCPEDFSFAAFLIEPEPGE